MVKITTKKLKNEEIKKTSVLKKWANFILVATPKVLLFYQPTLIRMRNPLDAIDPIWLYQYVVQQQRKVMASLNHLADLLIQVYCRSRQWVNNMLTERIELICKKGEQIRKISSEQSIQSLPNIGSMRFETLNWSISTNIIQNTRTVFVSGY